MNDYAKDTFSIVAEQAVLGAIIIDNVALERIGSLEGRHFFHYDHGLIFAELQRQITAGQRADVITIYEEIGYDIKDCLAYCTSLRQSALTSSGIERHADIIIDKAKKRDLIMLGEKLQLVGYSLSSADECIDKFAGELEELGRVYSDKEPTLLSDMMTDYCQLLQRRRQGLARPLSTGFSDLDNLMDGGMSHGTLVVVAGRPSMGKTAFGLNIARNVACSGVALVLSMEMPADDTTDRNMSAIGGIPVQWLRNLDLAHSGNAQDQRYEAALTNAIQATRNMRLFMDDQTGLNLLSIRFKARRVKRQAGSLDLLVIDQLSFITGGKGDRIELTGEYTRGLVALAKELNIVVVLLCQLNRKCEERMNPHKRPILSDLAQSGSIEQDANTVLFLYRDEVYNPGKAESGLVEVILAKNRQGRIGTVPLTFVDAHTRFDDMPPGWLPKKASNTIYQSTGFE